MKGFEITIQHGKPKQRIEFNCVLLATDEKQAWSKGLTTLYIEKGIKEPVKPSGILTEITSINQLITDL